MKTPDHTLARLDQLQEFDTVIDVRSPAEFAEDHIPGAINCPVLDDAERITIGTLYKQVSPFEARKVGAVLVARNIARHIEERLAVHPKSWRPLVYCWRGGQRSGAFTHVLREIGWAARRLEGGYKTWRHHVLHELESLPARFHYQVIAGPTGSGKSRLLEALARQGAQILHLEALAAHKGSVLGDLPDAPQPSQKMFETSLHAALSALDTTRPVYLEAESRKIGRLSLPAAIMTAIAAAPHVQIDTDIPVRVDFLLRDYAYLCDPPRLADLLARLKEIQGKATIAAWQDLATAGNFHALTTALLSQHYDPLYARSLRQRRQDKAPTLIVRNEDLSDAGIEALARTILARLGAEAPAT